MPVYEFGQDGIERLQETTFSIAGLQERRDLQRLIRQQIEVIAPQSLVISEEFGDWQDSRRRIDLLAIDKGANLIVVELKRTEDGGYMELQSLRYAAMVSTMTFDQAADAYEQYLTQSGETEVDARMAILQFLDWEEPDDDKFAQEVRIVLASAEFSKELTSSVLWLVDHGVDIRCVRLKPYSLGDRLLVDVQQIIPLPEAADFQTQVREKAQKERQSRASNADFTRFDVRVGNESHQSMWKRHAIFVICKHLCQNGVNPDDIAPLFDWRPSTVWCSVDGTLDAQEFEKLATEQAVSNGNNFSAGRWFCGDGELIHANNKTYALSNQWGGQGWHKAMGRLKEKYSQFGIEFSAAPDS